jgi:hypothetical protein
VRQLQTILGAMRDTVNIHHQAMTLLQEQVASSSRPHAPRPVASDGRVAPRAPIMSIRCRGPVDPPRSPRRRRRRPSDVDLAHGGTAASVERKGEPAGEVPKP